MLDMELKKKAIEEISKMLEGRMTDRLKPKMVSIEIEAKGANGEGEGENGEMENESEMPEGSGLEYGGKMIPKMQGKGLGGMLGLGEKPEVGMPGLGIMKGMGEDKMLAKALPPEADISMLSPEELTVLKTLYQKMGV